MDAGPDFDKPTFIEQGCAVIFGAIVVVGLTMILVEVLWLIIKLFR